MNGMASGLGSSSQEIGSNYLKLLITQLRHQNPLEPMDNNEMAGQLAQLSQLEQLENLNGSFSQVLQAVQVQEGSALVGKEVAFTVPDENGEQVAVSGVVEGAEFQDGELCLVVGPHRIRPKDVLSIYPAN